MAPVFEPRLGRFLAILAGTNLLGPGDVLEAGANDGRAAGELSELLKPRKVLAIEPLIVNAEKAKAIAKDHANMEARGRGSDPRLLTPCSCYRSAPPASATVTRRCSSAP